MNINNLSSSHFFVYICRLCTKRDGEYAWMLLLSPANCDPKQTWFILRLRATLWEPLTHFPHTNTAQIIFLGCFMLQFFVCTILLAVVNYPTIKTEIEIMKELHHERLLRLYAVCTTSEPICLVTELMKNGSLKTFLISKWTNINCMQIINTTDTFTLILDLNWHIAFTEKNDTI